MDLETDLSEDMLAAGKQEVVSASPEAYSPREYEKKARFQRVHSFVRDRYTIAKDARNPHEQRWLEALRAWRGDLSAEEAANMAQLRQYNPMVSEIFIKITKTKSEAAHAQILEVLLSDNKFPVGVKPTPIPEGVADVVHLAPEQAAPEPQDIYGFPGDGKEIPRGATTATLLSGFGDTIKRKFGSIAGKWKEGPSPDKTKIPQVHPADEAAYRMERRIHDQIEETRLVDDLIKATQEQVIYGTGAIKGPFSVWETTPAWEKDKATGQRVYMPVKKLCPKAQFVTIWNLFPDPEATSIHECEYLIERHLLGPSKVRELLNRPFFDKMAVQRILDTAPEALTETWDYQLDDSNISAKPLRYEIIEYWGTLDRETLEALEVSIPDEYRTADTIHVNVWVAKDEVLRVVVNPFTPSRIPYQMFPYERHPAQIWGIGVPENMSDTQAAMNTHYRAALDNLKFAGSCVFEVDETNLSPGQDMTIYPGKMFFRQGGAPGQSIYSISFNNTAPAHIQMFDKARQLADESTGIYSYSHGATGVSGTTRTASGMSMLMGAAALNIKKVIRNIDQYLLEPLGQGYFHWNMQFSDDLEVVGDLKIVAKGTTALLQKEIKTQRLLSLVQVGANQIMAPFINWPEIIKEIARSLDLDPDKVINDPQQAMLYMMALNAGQKQGPEGAGVPSVGGQMGEGGGATGGVNPRDVTGSGGGTIGVGASPMPGEAGFSGNA